MKRCDHLPLLNANPGKIARAEKVIAAMRAWAPAVAADQWVRFFRTGRFQFEMSEAEEAACPALAAAKEVLASQRLQMLRKQVVGQLQGFISNRANEFVEAVMGSTLPERTRHELLSINKRRAWFSPQPITLPKAKEPIASEVRHLARRIMHAMLSRHRRPSFDRLNPWIDRRQATLRPAETAEMAPIWLDLTTMGRKLKKDGTPGKVFETVSLPLASTPVFEVRGGTLAQTVQLITRESRNGRHGSEIVVGVVSDMEEVFAASRAAYRPKCEELALDFGLRTMLATSRGDLLGRDWIESLKRYDDRIAGLAARLQALGIKPNRSKRYRARVADFRGYLRTEIGRVLNRLVQTRAPAHLVLERLSFRHPKLSRRMNRLLTKCGRAILREKLKDLEERYGITWEEVNPAYSSQTCSNPECGYVSKTNRKAQAIFVCGACGMKQHADVNASRNLLAGRSSFDRASRVTKEAGLQLTVMCHLERLGAARQGVVLDPSLWPRPTRDRVISERSVHVSNPYFRDVLKGILPLPDSGTSGGSRKSQRRSAPIRRPAPPAPDLVADVSAG
jgi:putative transposase